ncbi:hypothetical protein ACOMHN_007318 [Nucella lapillus]
MTEKSREGDSLWNHPVLRGFLQQHEDCSPSRVCQAFQVYLNLAEVRGWREVKMHYCADLQRPFVTGRSGMGAGVEAAYPIAMGDSLSHLQIQTLFTALRLGDQQSFDRIMLAVCASDASIVYYNVSNSIIKPEPPDASDARKQEWHQKAAKRKRHVAGCIEHFSQTQSEMQKESETETQSDNAP